MPSRLPQPESPGRGGPVSGLATAILMVASAWSVAAWGQEPAPLGGAFAAPAATPVDIKVGQGRLLTLNQDLDALPNPNPRPAPEDSPFVAVGDPRVVDFYILNARQIRVIGKALGTTDLTITGGARLVDGQKTRETLTYEVRVVADLDDLRAHLRKMFPDASLELSQLREKIVVAGQARSADQVARIVATVDTFIRSSQRVQVGGVVSNRDERALAVDPNAPPLPPGVAQPIEGGDNLQTAPASGSGGPAGGQATNATAGLSGPPAASVVNGVISNQTQVINLIRVPTSQQVLLKVRVAELNRTAFRQVGADLLAAIPEFGTLFGTQIAGNGFAGGRVGATTFGDARSLNLGSQATVFGTFSQGDFNAVLTALRRNNLFKVLAEPNLIALNGHEATFLAGGQFPVPTFSGVGAGATGGGGTSTTQFKSFGVGLKFLPIILDGETVRLTVDPEVSSIDRSLETTLVPGGSPVPGLNIRQSHTTVELKQGDTLAIAGLMQLELAGSTQKIPGLGDLPYIGGFFSNTTSSRVEKELIVLVTPYIVEPMPPGQVPPSPGDEVVGPNDLEFYFLNRIEGRTGIDGRATTNYDDPLHLIRHSILERKYLVGPSGFSK